MKQEKIEDLFISYAEGSKPLAHCIEELRLIIPQPEEIGKGKENFTHRIMIRKGNDNQGPCVVYVKSYNEDFDLFVTPKINSGELLFSKEIDLIDFDFETTEKMYYEYRLNELPNIQKRFEEELLKFNQQK